jgi:muramidase (phage lysozyme)
MTPNTQAFLAMIRHSEGTDRGANPYAVCFGFKFVITDFSDHPAVLGVWHGESLDSLGGEYVGKVSTAAGAYQIIKPTWLALRTKLKLRDFTGPSQDAAALELVREAGALDIVYAGRVAEAIGLCKGIWASLPGSSAGQQQRSMADLINAYGNAGGEFA